MKKIFLLMLLSSLLQIKPCGKEKQALGAQPPFAPAANAVHSSLELSAANKYTIMNRPDRLIPGGGQENGIPMYRRGAGRLSQADIRKFCGKCTLRQLVNGTRHILKAQ